MSLASAHSVMTTLIEADIEFRRVDTGVERWWRELDGVDLAINMQHGSGGEDGVHQWPEAGTGE